MNMAGCSELKDRLNELVGDFVKTLSGGQRQRVAIARELLEIPKLFYLMKQQALLIVFRKYYK